MKFILGILVLVLAFLLQLWFPIGGVHIDFVLAALIAFTFVFPFWEVVFYILLAVFITNWRPGLSADIVAFALVPLAAFVAQLWLKWEPWMGVAIATALGVFAFYGIVAPAAFLPNISLLIADAIACVLFAELVQWGMRA